MKLRNDKGSITIFVLVGLLFMSAFLIISYASNVNKSKIVDEQSNIMDSLYMKNENIVYSYQEVYSALRKKNKQILTTTVEDSNTVELTNTFEENLYNYKIYGRTISEKDNGLPEGYKAVEYIESTGAQYIDTGYIPKANTRWELDLQFTQIISDTPQFNGRYDGGKRFDIAISSAGQFQLNINDSNNVAVADTNRHMFFLDSKNLKVGYDDNSFNVSSALLESSVTVGLFGRHESGNAKVRYYCNQKLYSCAFYEDDILVSYMQPCLDSEGIPCLYDKTRQITLYNQTDSDFKYQDIKDKKCVGDLITDSTDSNYQKYNIPIKITNNNGESQTINIYLDKPLGSEEYIDFKSSNVVRNDGTEESIDLPELSTLEDYTKIEVLTEITPSNIEVDYYGYILNNLSKYTQLEYLESTGTQYFDLGIIPQKNFGAYQKCSKAGAEANEALFGCRETSGDTRFIGFTAYRGDLSCGYSKYNYFNSETYGIGSKEATTNINYIPNTVFEAWTNYKNDRKLKAKSEDGSFDFTCTEEIGSTSLGDLATFTKTIHVFGYMDYNNIVVGCSCRIYALEITDGEKVVSKLIPCLDDKGVPCMYDSIRDITFYNEGTGEFIAGPEV